jgi:hypothetical protein
VQHHYRAGFTAADFLSGMIADLPLIAHTASFI